MAATTLFNRRIGRAGLAMLTLLSLGVVQAHATETIEVTLDKAKLLTRPPHTETIVIGNPSIADITTFKNESQILLTGKGFGETNLIFMDASGSVIEEANVRVGSAGTTITVDRGLDRESYSCLPRCEPTVTLGDANNFLSDASKQITSRNALAAPSSH